MHTGERKLKGLKLKGAKIEGRRNLKGLRYPAFHIFPTYSDFHDEVVTIKRLLKENYFLVPFGPTV